MDEQARLLKILFVGEPKCGKTSLISSYIKGVASTGHKPTLFENYTKDIEVDNVQYKLHICDTSGLSDFYRLKRMSYLNTDVFVVCIDYGEENSLHKTEKWIEDIRKSNAPIVLCLTKADGERLLSQEEIHQFALKHGIQGIAECSVNNKKSLKNLFETAVRVVLEEVPQESYSYCGFCCR